MPLSERLRINDGRPFLLSLIARMLVALILIATVMFIGAFKTKNVNYGYSKYTSVNTYAIPNVNQLNVTKIPIDS